MPHSKITYQKNCNTKKVFGILNVINNLESMMISVSYFLPYSFGAPCPLITEVIKGQYLDKSNYHQKVN